FSPDQVKLISSPPVKRKAFRYAQAGKLDVRLVYELLPVAAPFQPQLFRFHSDSCPDAQGRVPVWLSAIEGNQIDGQSIVMIALSSACARNDWAGSVSALCEQSILLCEGA